MILYHPWKVARKSASWNLYLESEKKIDIQLGLHTSPTLGTWISHPKDKSGCWGAKRVDSDEYLLFSPQDPFSMFLHPAMCPSRPTPTDYTNGNLCSMVSYNFDKLKLNFKEITSLSPDKSIPSLDLRISKPVGPGPWGKKETNSSSGLIGKKKNGHFHIRPPLGSWT